MITKPWGWELILGENPEYTLKKLFMKNGHRCSLQLHDKKVETIYVLKGILTIEIDGNMQDYNPDDFVTIERLVIHRMSAKYGDVVYLEASTTYPNDVIRLEDDYNRI